MLQNIADAVISVQSARLPRFICQSILFISAFCQNMKEYVVVTTRAQCEWENPYKIQKNSEVLKKLKSQTYGPLLERSGVQPLSYHDYILESCFVVV